jgi:hypothetical protein
MHKMLVLQTSLTPVLMVSTEFYAVYSTVKLMTGRWCKVRWIDSELGECF